MVYPRVCGGTQGPAGLLFRIEFSLKLVGTVLDREV